MGYVHVQNMPTQNPFFKALERTCQFLQFNRLVLTIWSQKNSHSAFLQGLVGLFRGITPTVLGILPYSGLAFAFNEQAKQKVRN